MRIGITKGVFNERHQQIGLNPTSLKFIKSLDIAVWGEINRKGCMNDDWINIPIYILQNLLMKEIKKYNVKICFDTKIESVTCQRRIFDTSFNPKSNCRVLMIKEDKVIGVLPKLVVIANGRHDDKDTSKLFFDFPSASKVHLCTCGIMGMIVREMNEEKAAVCLRNYSSAEYTSDINKEVGMMHVRLLGNMKERYILLGIAKDHHLANFMTLDKNSIRLLLVEAYNKLRDKNMGNTK